MTAVLPSVETLSSALRPVAPENQAHHNDKKEPKHREENRKKDGYPTHPFVSVIGC